MTTTQEAYNTVIDMLRRSGEGALGFDPGLVAMAKSFARHNNLRWPPVIPPDVTIEESASIGQSKNPHYQVFLILRREISIATETLLSRIEQIQKEGFESHDLSAFVRDEWEKIDRLANRLVEFTNQYSNYIIEPRPPNASRKCLTCSNDGLPQLCEGCAIRVLLEQTISLDLR